MAQMMAQLTPPNLADSMEDSSDYIPTTNTAEDLFRFILNTSQEYVFFFYSSLY